VSRHSRGDGPIGTSEQKAFRESRAEDIDLAERKLFFGSGGGTSGHQRAGRPRRWRSCMRCLQPLDLSSWWWQRFRRVANRPGVTRMNPSRPVGYGGSRSPSAPRGDYSPLLPGSSAHGGRHEQ
jgi:hypothetical protein